MTESRLKPLLIVEDNPGLQKQLKWSFEGYQVFLASDRATAIELLEQQETPVWLIKAVDQVRAQQPTEWAPGETPWPKAPQGANASKMDGLRDETAK